MLSRAGDAAVRLTARVTPKGGRDRIEGWARDADGAPVLRLRVAAPPTDGAANAAVVKLLAKAFGVPKSAVTLLAGATARTKRLEISGDPETLAQRLAEHLAAAPLDKPRSDRL